MDKDALEHTRSTWRFRRQSRPPRGRRAAAPAVVDDGRLVEVRQGNTLIAGPGTDGR